MPTSPAVRARRINVMLAAGLIVLCLIAVTLLNRDTSTPVPSFDDPIGALDVSAVPNGWGDDVAAAARTAGIPAPVLAAQLDTESHWNPKAVSPVGAQGLAQFTPDAWSTYGKGDPFDPHDAIAAQGRLMRAMRHRADTSGIADNHVKLALAGYNAGFENVVKHRGVPPFPETQNYVDAVARRMGHYALPLPSSSTTSTHR